MPWLKVNGKCTLALSPTLIHVPASCQSPVTSGHEVRHILAHARHHAPDVAVREGEVLPGSVIEDPQHGNNPIGCAICPPDVGSHSSDVVY